MRNDKIAAVVSVLLLAGCAHQPMKVVEAPKTKLYDMFQKYCVATGGRFDAVNTAATADGFVHHQGQGVMAQILHIGVGSVSWQKGKDVVSIGPLHNDRIGADGKRTEVPYDPPGAKAEYCSIRIQAERDDSQGLIAKWAGVPVQHSPRAAEVGDEISDRYGFRIENGMHVATNNYFDRSANAAMAGTWSAFLYKRGTEYDASLYHIYVPSEAKTP
jgi:hypothetical protein